MTTDADQPQKMKRGFLDEIPVDVIVELGRTRMVLRELAALDVDDVIELDQGQDRPLELVAGGRVVAKGELVLVGDRVAVRINEIPGRTRGNG